MLVSSMLVIVIQTKCITMLAFVPDYFDHAATLPGHDKTIEEFPLPDITPWATLHPTPTPKLNTTTKTSTTKGLQTKYFYVGKYNMTDIFTVTKSTLPTTPIEPYLTGFVSKTSPKVTFPSFVIMSTVDFPKTDIIIPTMIADKYISKLTTSTGTEYYTTSGEVDTDPYPKYPVTLPKKFTHITLSTIVSPITLPKKVPPITLPKKVPPITLPKKVPPNTLPKKALRITLPKKVPRITLSTKAPHITLPKKVPPNTLPKKALRNTLPKKVTHITLSTIVSPITLPKKVPPITLPKKVPRITLPKKVPRITLPKKVPPATLPKKVLRNTLPNKVPRITLPTKDPPITLPKKVLRNTLPKKVPRITLPTKVPPITLPKKVPLFSFPKKVHRSGLNRSTTMKKLLRVSPTVPTTTSQTVTGKAANKTNTTNPSVKVSTTVKLKADTTTSPKNNGLTTVKPTSNNPKPALNNVKQVKPTTTNPWLNKAGNETDVPKAGLNESDMEISNTSTTVIEINERTPKQEGPTTTPIYEDVIEYEELKTEPFSKFLERVLFQVAKMNKTYATRFIHNFDRIATTKSNAGGFHHFGGVTIRYIDEMLPGLETSTDTLQRMFALAYSNLKSRRKTLAVDTNELLDYIDMMFSPSEEQLMQDILNHIMKYPNTSKTAADICTDIISSLIITPSKRLSGTKKGNVLFQSLDKVIVSRHPSYDHYRKNIENKGKKIATVTNPVGKSNRRNLDSFHYSNSRKLKALNHDSESNRRYDGSVEDVKGKKSKDMHHLNKGNRRELIHVNEDNRKQYDRINNALRREIEPTNHGTEFNRKKNGNIHNDKSREIEDINHVNTDKRKYDNINYSKGRQSKVMRNFNKGAFSDSDVFVQSESDDESDEANRKNTGSINIAKNKENKATNHFNKSNTINYKMARKNNNDRRFGKENLRRSYNTFNGRFQTTGWKSNEIERDNDKYDGETDNVMGAFSDSDEFVQSESDDESDEIEMSNMVFNRIQKQKSKSDIEPVITTKTVRRQGRNKIKWGLPRWNPNENEFAVLRQGYHPSQRRTDRYLKQGFPDHKNKFEMFREGRPSSELPSDKVFIKNENNNNMLRTEPQYDNVNFSAPMKSQFQNNIRPTKSFVSRQLKMLQNTKRFHNYKPSMEENGEPNPSFLNPMDKTLTPVETLNNNSNKQKIYKNVGRLNRVMPDDFDNSPSIIDFSMKVKLNKPQAIDGGEYVFVNDHNVNKVNMRGREAQVSEETRTWDPYQMDKYFSKTKVTLRDISNKRVHIIKPVSDPRDKSDGDVSLYERDVDDEESEQDESDGYTFKGVNRKNTHSKHHRKYRVNHHKRKNHDKYKHKKHIRDVRVRHGTHKKIRKKHGFRPNTKKRKHGRNKHSHHKNHRYYKNKRGKKTHRSGASDIRPVGRLYEIEESCSSEETSSKSTEQTLSIPVPENKKYKPIGKLMEFDKVSTLSNNEVETYKQPSKLNSPGRAESEAQPKNGHEVKDLENRDQEDKNNEGNVNNRNPKRRGAYVTIGLLMDDMIYRFRENELKRNVYDAFRQNYRRNYRRTLGHEYHGPVLPPLVVREDSVYTDDEAVLKRNIYKAIKDQNLNADQNKPQVLKRKF